MTRGKQKEKNEEGRWEPVGKGEMRSPGAGCTPVIPAIQEAGAGGLQIPGQQGQFSKTLF